MRRVFKSGNPSKFVRRVLSKTSNVSKSSEGNKKDEGEEIRGKRKKQKQQPRGDMAAEVAALKEQVGMLQISIAEMQQEVDHKDKALASIAREKERLTFDLRKQRRSNANLKQQLEDEREHYYREKKQYCQEMNDCKKLKSNLNRSECEMIEREVAGYIKEIRELRGMLNQTLEANYNLSIKFLRMQNTKTHLKIELQNLQEEHDKTVKDLKSKIEYIKSEISDVVETQFKLPVSPSSKKYLKIVKQNGNLLHENLCLQLEVDRLRERVHKIKQQQEKKKMRERLQFINSKTKLLKSSSSSVKNDNIHDNNKSNTENSTKEKNKRKEKRPRTAKVVIVEPQDEQVNNETEMQTQTQNEDAEVVEVKKIFEKARPPASAEEDENGNITAVDCEIENCSTVTALTIDKGSTSKLTLLQVSENPSRVSTEVNEDDVTSCASSYTAVRTQSAPEIVQSSRFNISKSTSSTVNSSIINKR